MLYQRALRIAKEAKSLHRVCLVTDAQEIADIYVPVELASDTTPLAHVLQYLVVTKQVEEDYLMLLQPTVPFRTAETIDACVAACLAKQAASLVTVCDGRPTGEVYITRKDVARTGRLYGSPTIRIVTERPINIDTEYDLLCAEEQWDAHERL